MLLRKKHLAYMLILFFLAVSISPSGISGPKDLPYSSNEPSYEWRDDWSYKQEILLPISTDSKAAIYQPIDIKIEFDQKCWAKNSLEHSIRVCCWDGTKWHELESQIYDLNYVNDTDTYIRSCGLVFLIPSFANGKERYYVYYNKEETPSPSYEDHVSINDCYYYYEPITGLSVEGDYYEVIEDGEIVYGVGQKGQVINRRLSQIVIRMEPGTKTFDILNTDLLASFSFAYHKGEKDEDEVSSDQRLLSKEIMEDGNLMIEFNIVSESRGGEIRSNNVYKYYYCPTSVKRINVHVKHEVLEDCFVEGVENVDGRFGSLMAYHSKSSATKKMCFGRILPFLHVYGENERVEEYQLNENPETRERNWVISYKDDCDLGSEAWIAYDEGAVGKTHGVLFSSNQGLIRNASGELDGIEVKAVEKEYLNLVGTEIDYTSINYGRNAFEPHMSHDREIPEGFTVEYDTEFITIQNGTYLDIQRESRFFQTLIKYRYSNVERAKGEQNIYTLTVIPHLTGRIGSFPRLKNLTGWNLPVLYAELYRNETLIAAYSVEKPFVGFQVLKFPKLAPGKYVVKIFRDFGNNTRRYIGFASTRITNDTTLHLYCTWQQEIDISIEDQHHQGIENVDILVLKEYDVVARNQTIGEKNVTLAVPFNMFNPYVIESLRNITIVDLFKVSAPYVLKVFYKGFKIHNEMLSRFNPSTSITLEVYDLIIEITDELGLPPGVDVKPFLWSDEMAEPVELTPEYLGGGRYLFEKLPAASYVLQISFGSYVKTKALQVPECGETTHIRFAATAALRVKLLNSRGEVLSGDSYSLSIKRDGEVIYTGVSPEDTLFLPPGLYVVNVYDQDNTLIGSSSVELTNDKTVKIVTNVPSLLFIIFSFASIGFMVELFFLLFFKKISLNTFLKLITMSLVILALFQPWWVLSAEATDQIAEKTTQMYIYPQKMIDQITYQGQQYFTLATIPEMFTEFLRILLMVIYVGLFLMGISFIPNIALKKRYSLLLVITSIVFVIIVAAAFLMGMKKIAEISLGSLHGEKILEILMPTGENLYMTAHWGLGPGFYLIVLAATISLLTGVIDFMRKKQLFTHFSLFKNRG